MRDWLNFAVVKDMALFLLAFYGAALSTFNWRQSIRKDRRMIDIGFSTEIPTYSDGTLGSALIKVEATNIGHRTVTVKTLAIELPRGERIFPMVPNQIPGLIDTVLPISLSDGQSAQLRMSYLEIANVLLDSSRKGKTKIIPVCEDSAGGVYKGKSWAVDPEEWSRMKQ